jgi:hypothetical protein
MHICSQVSQISINNLIVELLKTARVQQDSIAISLSPRGRPQDLKNSGGESEIP